MYESGSNYRHRLSLVRSCVVLRCWRIAVSSPHQIQMAKGNSSGSGKAVATTYNNKAVSAHKSGGSFGTNQKSVMYWENKKTGQYVRETATNKSSASENQNYHTLTVGNKFTGNHHTKQSQQVFKSDGKPNKSGWDIIKK